MLTQYQQQTQLLLDDPSQQQYNLADITTWVNTARGQIAASTQCIRFTGSIAVVANTATYLLSAITGLPAGVNNALSVRMISRAITGGGYSAMELRPWEWAFFYWYSNPNPSAGAPTRWSIQEPGPLGSIYVNPTPDATYTLAADCVGLPIALAEDSDPEAIPYPWTDSVPYFAAYWGYLNAQRQSDADQTIAKWAQFMGWGTKQTTPTVMPDYYPGGHGAIEAAQRILNTGLGMPAGSGGRRGTPGTP